LRSRWNRPLMALGIVKTMWRWTTGSTICSLTRSANRAARLLWQLGSSHRPEPGQECAHAQVTSTFLGAAWGPTCRTMSPMPRGR